ADARGDALDGEAAGAAFSVIRQARVSQRGVEGGVEKPGRTAVALQQSLDGATQIRITAAHRVEKAGALDRVAVECLLKYRLDAVPSRDIHAQRPCISLYSQA